MVGWSPWNSLVGRPSTMRCPWFGRVYVCNSISSHSTSLSALCGLSNQQETHVSYFSVDMPWLKLSLGDPGKIWFLNPLKSICTIVPGFTWFCSFAGVTHVGACSCPWMCLLSMVVKLPVCPTSISSYSLGQGHGIAATIYLIGHQSDTILPRSKPWMELCYYCYCYFCLSKNSRNMCAPATQKLQIYIWHIVSPRNG